MPLRPRTACMHGWQAGRSFVWSGRQYKWDHGSPPPPGRNLPATFLLLPGLQVIGACLQLGVDLGDLTAWLLGSPVGAGASAAATLAAGSSLNSGVAGATSSGAAAGSAGSNVRGGFNMGPYRELTGVLATKYGHGPGDLGGPVTQVSLPGHLPARVCTRNTDIQN